MHPMLDGYVSMTAYILCLGYSIRMPEWNIMVTVKVETWLNELQSSPKGYLTEEKWLL